MKNLRDVAPEKNLGLLLARVSRLVGREWRMKLEGIGLYHAQGMILFTLWREDGIAQNGLAQALHIAPPTVSSTLKRMERDGWIERHRDGEDQRIVRVYLTEKSKQLHEEAHGSFEDMHQELTALLTEEERKVLSQSLLKVYHYLFEKTGAGTEAHCTLSSSSTSTKK